jgi:hypothetical protein
MAAVQLTDLNRAIAYGESELGEVAVLNAAAQTYTILNAKTGATVLAAGQSKASIQSRVASIHPGIAKIAG